MLKQFFTYYRPYKGLFFLDFTCAIIAGMLELVFPFAVNQFIDNLLPGQDWPLIIGACIALLAIYALNTVLQYVVTYWGHMLGINIESEMRKKLFDHIQKLSFRFFDNNKTGKLMSRLSNDLMEIGEIAHHGPEDLFIALMTLLGAFAMMLSINWKLALLTFTVVPFLLWITAIFNKKMAGTFGQLNADIAAFNSQVESTVGGIRVVQAFGNETYENAKFTENNKRFRLTKLASYKIMALNFSISYMLMRLTSIFVLLCGTWFVIQGELTYGQFVAFVLFTNVLFRPIEKINAVIELYPKGIAGFKRYLELLETEPDIEDIPNALEVEQVHGDICYQGVSFSYDGKENILEDIDLTIQGGETVAFVGTSIAGK